MFYMRIVIKNIRLYKWKTFLHVLICILIVLFLNLYVGNLEHNKNQLESLGDKIPVEAVITNLAGGRESGIFIKESFYEGIMQSGSVKEVRFTLQLIDVAEDGENDVLGVNTWKAIPGIDKERIFLKDEMDVDEFFASNDKKCIITHSFLEANGFELGNNVEMHLYYYELNKEDHYSIFTKPLEKVNYEIIGVLDDTTLSETQQKHLPQIIIPIESARKSFNNKNIDFYVNSGMFTVDNPLKLNEFKEEMENMGFMELLPGAMNALEGYALIVKDETFIRASSSMEEGYNVMKKFFPIVAIISACSGFITSYLLTTGRRQEYAVMRSLGMSQKACFLTYLTEMGLVQLAGGFLGSIAAILSIDISIVWVLICFITFFSCFISGSIVAIFMLGKVSVMNILTKAD